jgi:hypothetical protein
MLGQFVDNDHDHRLIEHLYNIVHTHCIPIMVLPIYNAANNQVPSGRQT